MKFIKKYENFKLESKSKELGEISFPEFKGDKIYMLEFDLENPVLPEKYKRWESVVVDMIKNSPVKTGKAYLTVDEDDVTAGRSHRRGGVHVDGNYIYGFKDGNVVQIETSNESTSWGGTTTWSSGKDKKNKESWSYSSSWSSSGSDDNSVSWGSSTPSSWATGFLVGGLDEEQHFRQYCSNKGGMIISSNYEACYGWNGTFKGIPLDGGDSSHIDLSNLEKFKLEKNKVYIGNSTFLHESIPVNEDVKRQLIRITLPEVEVNI
jgi:hypothetical protein